MTSSPRRCLAVLTSHDLWGKGGCWNILGRDTAQHPQCTGRPPPKMLIALRLRSPGLESFLVYFVLLLKAPKGVTDAAEKEEQCHAVVRNERFISPLLWWTRPSPIFFFPHRIRNPCLTIIFQYSCHVAGTFWKHVMMAVFPQWHFQVANPLFPCGDGQLP